MQKNIAKWTRRAVLGGLCAGIATGAYAGVIEPYWRVQTTHYRPKLPQWPKNYPLRIAALADPHVSRYLVTPGHLAYISDLIASTDPDIIILLGDYRSSIAFTERSLTASQIAKSFARLKAPLGVHAILGNHDWWDDPDKQVRMGLAPTSVGLALQDEGINVMENQAISLAHRSRHFWLLGLGDQWAIPKGRKTFSGRDDLPGTLSQINDGAPAILLAHEPDIFPRVPQRVALTLSGHTHGGQIVFSGYAPVVPSRYGRRYRYGHIVEDNRHLIVSSGIGMGGIPLRFGMPPEVIVIDL